jgi:hypothetical protein
MIAFLALSVVAVIPDFYLGWSTVHWWLGTCLEQRANILG